MRTKSRIQIPGTLAAELFEASRLSGLPPEKIAAQIVEGWCAEARLARQDVAKKKAKGLHIGSQPANSH